VFWAALRRDHASTSRSARWYDSGAVPKTTTWLVAALLVSSIAATAQAQVAASHLETAVAQSERASFEEARASLRAAISAPGATREILADAYRYLATTEGVLGDPSAARRLAEVAVALDAEAQPAEGAPPEVVRVFDEARAAAGGPAISYTIEEAADGGRVVQARVARDLGELSRRLEIELVCGSSTSRDALPGVSLVLPRAATGTCEAEVELNDGTVVFSRTVTLARRDPSATGEAPGAADDTPWIVLGVVGGGLALVGLVIGIVFAATSGPVEGQPTSIVFGP
jgi:hypothetical protein